MGKGFFLNSVRLSHLVDLCNDELFKIWKVLEQFTDCGGVKSMFSFGIAMLDVGRDLGNSNSALNR